MSRAIVVSFLCAALSCSWLENVDAQSRNGHDSRSILESMEALTKVVENLQTEIKVQSSVLSNLVSKEELKSILLNNLATKSDMQMQKLAVQILEAKATMHENSLSNLQATVDELQTLVINSNVKEEKLVTSLQTLEAQSNMQTILLNNVGANLENQTALLKTFWTKQETQLNNLTNVMAKMTTVCDGAETLAGGVQNSSASKDVVEGCIAGTQNGVVVMPLHSGGQRIISSNKTNGVAFNWQSRKVYWIENHVGIKIAELDGSYAEVLVSDGSYLSGLAVDQITGNFYYSAAGSNPRIRVCDSMGEKCVTIVSGVNNLGDYIWDIALYPSKGLMFWSSPFDKKSVTQANMDGTNARVILLESSRGLYLDELTEKLYWANGYGKSIGRCDLNGDSQHVQLNTSIYANDIAVDGDTMYFSGSFPTSVYSITNNGKVSSILNTTGDVEYIALYGRNKVFSRSNPCKNSTCANLCVLTRVSYACL